MASVCAGLRLNFLRYSASFALKALRVSSIPRPPPASRRPGCSMLRLMSRSHNIAQGAFATSPSSPPGIILAPVKPCWVVDQQRLLGRRGGRDPRDKVDQRPVVGGLFLHVGMRPVGPPDDAVGELLDQALGEGHHVVIGRS